MELVGSESVKSVLQMKSHQLRVPETRASREILPSLETVQNFLLGGVVLFGKIARKKRIPPLGVSVKFLYPESW